jgi:hypothetical protein
MYRSLIDAYALLGRRVWSVVGPRWAPQPASAAGDAHPAV